MHIPDNFLSTPVWVTLDGFAAPAIALISRRARQSTDTRRLPLLGVMGAFIFAAQMINFPVGAGTSGHLVGGTLLACVLGPEAAVLTVTSILLVQALIFQDGGVLALGANVFNMALCGVIAGYAPYSLFRETKAKYRAAFFGGVCSVLVSGLLALSELALSGIRISRSLLALSLVLFAANAVMEGAITATVLKAIERLNPELANDSGSHSRSFARRSIYAVGLAALALGASALLITSTAPDGLEQLGLHLGMPWNAHPVLRAPLADYRVQMLGSGSFSRVTAGLLGVIAVYTICLAGSRLVTRARRSHYS